MITVKILHVAAASLLVAAWPEPTAAARLDARAVNCAEVTGILDTLKKIGPPATSFCSSFLQIPRTKTITTTFTPATVTRTTSTKTVTTTKASCDQRKRDMPFDYQPIEHADLNAARGLEERYDVRYLLAGYSTAKISEGCRCLNLRPKTTTVTRTAATPTKKVVATTTTCVANNCKPNGAGQSCDRNSDCCAGACNALDGVLTCCKLDGVGRSCAQNSDCCAGFCGIQFNTPTCCAPLGAPCDFSNPGTCCSGTCQTNGLGGFEGNCI